MKTTSYVLPVFVLVLVAAAPALAADAACGETARC